jgi:hypothetical protein
VIDRRPEHDPAWPEPFRLLVTGSRQCTKSQADFVVARLEALARPVLNVDRRVIVVHGQCPYGGVDLVADRWAEDTAGCEAERHPAERTPSGRLLGPARNRHMVGLGADACAAFPALTSSGTWDCLNKAIHSLIPTHVWMLHPDPEGDPWTR